MNAKKKSAGTKHTPLGYEEFLRSLRLLGLGLENCSAKLDRDAYFKVSTKREGVRQIEAKYELGAVGDNFFEPTAQFTVTVLGHKKEKTAALSIQCAFSAHFHANGRISHEYAKRFTDSEFRVVTWPYFRQFVMDLTSRMAIPPLLVPFASPSELRK